MPKRNMIAVAVSIIGLATNVSAQSITPSEIIEQATATYGFLQTYKAEGTIVSDIDDGTMKMTTETSFSILLKKPNLYLISWTQKISTVGKNQETVGKNQDAAVWSDGTQPYLYMGIMKA